LSGAAGEAGVARVARRPPPRFSAGALRVIADASRGNPRLVNAICHEALDRASNQSLTQVNDRLIRGVSRDLGLLDAPRRLFNWRPRWPAIVGSGLAVGLGLGLLVAGRMRTAGRAPAVLNQSAAPVVQRPAAEPQIDGRTFQTLRQTTLTQAAALSTVPDVKGLLKLRDGVLQWQRDTAQANSQALEDLLTEVERLTNDARARRLALDRQEFLDEAKSGK
jgi:hypothetical protein